ncbi:PREDICTED: protein NDR1-like [Camelina sativa]|uniref:Protein NDR1-like n=1 Tax=Camelina sativa TaxID=90675 RepID=A0ABM0T3G2_CAMSA|nr:PREDICTED: protein NDR1-like [Camelina sativa]
MVDREEELGKEICSCFLKFIFTVGLSCLAIWLYLRAGKPKCSVQNFYVPALNKTLNSRDNTTLSFMVRCDNPNKVLGIYYDDVHLTFFTTNTTTKSNSSALVFVGNYTVPKFYQGHKKKAKKWGQVLPLNNQTVLRAVLPNGSAVFRLDLKTRVRFRSVFWKTKSRGINVGADVEVNGDGVIAQKKGVQMKKSILTKYNMTDEWIVVGADDLGGGSEDRKKGTKMMKSDSSFPLSRISSPICVLMNLLVFVTIH